MRKEDESGRASRALGRAALAALYLVLGCLNPRPEELPSSSADPAQPSAELGDPSPDRDDPTARAGGAGAGEGVDEVNAADEPAPAEPASPAFAPEAAPAPEPADAGADATSPAEPDAG